MFKNREISIRVRKADPEDPTSTELRFEPTKKEIIEIAQGVGIVVAATIGFVVLVKASANVMEEIAIHTAKTKIV